MESITADEVGQILAVQVPRLVREAVSERLGKEIRDAVEDALDPLVDRVDRLDRTVFGPLDENERALAPGALGVLIVLQRSVDQLTQATRSAETSRAVNRRWISALAVLASLGGGAVATVGQAVVAGWGL